MLPTPAAFSLEALASFEERSALVDLVKEQLAPPAEAVETFARLRNGLTEPSEIEPAIHRALNDQLEWVHRELLGLMSGKIRTMLDWCVRLKVTTPSAEWSPQAWVKASQAMACESTLVESVIAHAPTASWPLWREALRVDENWAAKWQGWARAFEKTPVQALQWLDEFLVKPSSQNDAQWQALLGAYRGRLALQIFLCEQRKGPSVSLVALDERLKKAGAPCLLEAIDFSPLFKANDRLVSAEEARLRLAKFLLTRPAESKPWLEAPLALASHGLKVDLLSKPTRLWAFLSIIGYHQRAGARDLEMALEGVSKGPFGGPEWAQVMSPALYESLSATRPVLVPPPVKKKPAKKAKAEKPVAAPTKVTVVAAEGGTLKADAVQQKHTAPAVYVPRFPRRT